jgi:phage regulator Rha-like protein
MGTSLIILKNEKLYISTNIISKKCDVEHRSILKLIKTHREDIEYFGKLIEDIEKIPKGRPLSIFLLNEEQFTFLVTLMQNSKVTVQAKKYITKEFFKMRKWILEQKTQKQNQQYIETRNQSKIGRKQETDIIKIFVEYAKSQGSQSADKYYMIISKMENSAFFVLQEKFKNVREMLNIKQLSLIIVADMIVKQSIIEGMDKEMFYKDIFQLAKKRVLAMANSLGFKEVLPGIEFKQISMLD